MRQLFLTIIMFSSVAANATDIGGVVSSGNAMIDAAKAIHDKVEQPIQVIELNSGQTINVYAGNISYFIDSKGNRIPVPDGEYYDRTGKSYLFSSSVLRSSK